jgi:hypothetical protein
MDSAPSWALHRIEELHDEELDDEGFRSEARDILARVRRAVDSRASISKESNNDDPPSLW